MATVKQITEIFLSKYLEIRWTGLHFFYLLYFATCNTSLGLIFKGTFAARSFNVTGKFDMFTYL
jgi:hypothetical protein